MVIFLLAGQNADISSLIYMSSVFMGLLSLFMLRMGPSKFIILGRFSASATVKIPPFAFTAAVQKIENDNDDD
jgi:hypothetical protein